MPSDGSPQDARAGNARSRNTLPEGKIPPALLREALRRLGGENPDGLELGPAPGEDAAVVASGGQPRLVFAADPITFPSPDPGWHAVIANTNDVAATGGEPRWFLAQVVLPPGTRPERTLEIADGIRRGCAETGVAPVGGHTEVSSAVRREVVAGAMIGVATPERIKPSGGAREGDLLVITKGIAIEATAVVASGRSAEVRKVFGAEFQERAARFLEDPGLSVLPEARIAAGMLEVHAMHDVTEGGVATAIREMAEAAGLGVVVAETEIPRHYESKRLLAHFGLDILGAIGSGALLVACSGSGTKELLDRLGEARVSAAVIGRFVRESEGLRLLRGTVRRELPVFEADELTRLDLDSSGDPPSDSPSGIPSGFPPGEDPDA